VENSEASPLLRFATQQKERPPGGFAAHTLEGAAPLQTSQQKERLYEANRRASLAFSGRALAPLPHPPRASTKTKTLLWMVGLVWPLCLSVEPCKIEQKRPRTSTEQCRLPPVSKIRLKPSDHLPTGYKSDGLFRFRPDFFAPHKMDWTKPLRGTQWCQQASRGIALAQWAARRILSHALPTDTIYCPSKLHLGYDT